MSSTVVRMSERSPQSAALMRRCRSSLEAHWRLALARRPSFLLEPMVGS